MKKINVTQAKIYKDLSKKDFAIFDIKNELANFIYNNTNGLKYHSFAMKLYNSNGIVEINEEEEELLNEIKSELKPCIIDAIDDILGKAIMIE